MKSRPRSCGRWRYRGSDSLPSVMTAGCSACHPAAHPGAQRQPDPVHLLIQRRRRSVRLARSVGHRYTTTPLASWARSTTTAQARTTSTSRSMTLMGTQGAPFPARILPRRRPLAPAATMPLAQEWTYPATMGRLLAPLLLAPPAPLLALCTARTKPTPRTRDPSAALVLFRLPDLAGRPSTPIADASWLQMGTPTRLIWHSEQ